MPASGPHIHALVLLHPHTHCAHTHENTHTYKPHMHTQEKKVVNQTYLLLNIGSFHTELIIFIFEMIL